MDKEREGEGEGEMDTHLFVKTYICEHIYLWAHLFVNTFICEQSGNGTGDVATGTLPVDKEEEINKTRIEVIKSVIQLITLQGMGIVCIIVKIEP